FESFVGAHPVATRHGMTIGELAVMYKAGRKIDVELEVVRCEGWRREDGMRSSDIPWVPPSPNMPAERTAWLYPGMCLIEGTNLSEGRGTTRPFEYVGFPGADAYRVAERLNAEQLPGILRFLPVYFRPMFQKHAGKTCGGVLVLVDSFHDIQPVRLGLAVIAAFREVLGERFRWRTERYEFVDDKPAIDLLFGSDRERRALEAGVPWREIAAAWEPEEEAFRERRRPYPLYPD